MIYNYEPTFELWQFIVCLLFGIFFLSLNQFKANLNLKSENLSDLRYFGYALLTFSFSALLVCAIIKYQPSLDLKCYKDDINDIIPDLSMYCYLYYSFRALISAINNLFIFKSLAFIQLENPNNLQNWIQEQVRKPFMPILLLGIEITAIIFFSFDSFGEKSPLRIYTFNMLITFIAVFFLALFIGKAVIERNLRFTLFFVVSTIILMGLTQIDFFFNLDYVFLNVASPAYKSLLIGLFFLLLISFESKKRMQEYKIANAFEKALNKYVEDGEAPKNIFLEDFPINSRSQRIEEIIENKENLLEGIIAKNTSINENPIVISAMKFISTGPTSMNTFLQVDDKNHRVIFSHKDTIHTVNFGKSKKKFELLKEFISSEFILVGKEKDLIQTVEVKRITDKMGGDIKDIGDFFYSTFFAIDNKKCYIKIPNKNISYT